MQNYSQWGLKGEITPDIFVEQKKITFHFLKLTGMQYEREPERGLIHNYIQPAKDGNGCREQNNIFAFHIASIKRSLVVHHGILSLREEIT